MNSDTQSRLKESTSSNSIKHQLQTNDQSSSLNKLSKVEMKSESSSSGPSTTSQSSYMPAFTKNNLLSSTYTKPSSVLISTSNSYKDLSTTIPTTKPSPSIEKSVSKDEDITLYKPTTYSQSCHIISSSNVPVTTTSSFATSHGASTVTISNGKSFKLPEFPVYIPSTTPTIKHADSGVTSKTEPSSTAFSSKYSDSDMSSSVTTAYSATLSRLSASSTSSSPSRTINSNVNTNTLPLNLGRNNPYLYQSESNSNNSNVTSTNSNNPTTSYASPVTSHVDSSKTNYSNVYGTLPKTNISSLISKFDSDNDKATSSYSGSAYSSSYKYNTDYYSTLPSSSTSKNDHTNNGTATSSANDNTYRVQYSATNPFLDPIESTSNNSDNLTSHTRSGNGSVSDSRKLFEKLDSEEDLK